MKKNFKYNELKYNDKLLINGLPHYNVSFCRLVGMISDVLLNDKIEKINTNFDLDSGAIEINFYRYAFSETRLYTRLITESIKPLIIEFYMDNIYPFLYANIYEEPGKKLFDFFNSKRQFLLTSSPELVEKDKPEGTYKIWPHASLNKQSEFSLNLTEWKNQKVTSYAQLGAADQFQKTLLNFQYDGDFIKNFELIWEKILFEAA